MSFPSKQTVAFWSLTLGIFCIVGAFWKQKRRLAREEAMRMSALRMAASELGFEGAGPEEESYFTRLVSNISLGQGNPGKVSLCFLGKRHDVEVRVCDFG